MHCLLRLPHTKFHHRITGCTTSKCVTASVDTVKASAGLHLQLQEVDGPQAAAAKKLASALSNHNAIAVSVLHSVQRLKGRYSLASYLPWFWRNCVDLKFEAST